MKSLGLLILAGLIFYGLVSLLRESVEDIVKGIDEIYEKEKNKK